jgi:phage terminase large subunit-like protein
VTGEERWLPEGAWFDPETGGFVRDFVQLLPLSDGSGPFRLQDWQRRAVEDFYGTLTTDEVGRTIRQYQYLYLEVPKTNGKSELAAALGLYHLLADGEERPEVYCVAADRENAGIVFNAILYMIEHTPALQKMRVRGQLKVVESQKRIRYKGNCGELKVLSSEAYSKHGYKPSCVIFDELHAQPNRALWDVMTFGAGDARRQPVWLVLTTAGDDPDRNSIGWEVHTKAMDILRARGMIPAPLDENGQPVIPADNPLWLPVIYGMSALTGDDEDAIKALDIQDPALWRACNPSLGVTVPLRVVRAEAREAKTSEAAERLFRWLRLNQWISTKAVGWLPLTLYDKTQIGPSAMKDREAWIQEHLWGKKCYGGLDLSTTTDLTAFVLLFPPQEGLEHWVALFRAWRPEATVSEAEQRDHVPYRDWARAGFLDLCDGDMIDYSQVEAAIVEAMALYDLKTLGVDPYLSRTLTQRLMELGLEVIEIPQTMLSMSPAMKELERLIRAHQMRHVHNTTARWCFGNVRCAVDGNENMKPMKNKSIGRIDITVAWIIAMATAMVKENQEGDKLNEALEKGVFTF